MSRNSLLLKLLISGLAVQLSMAGGALDPQVLASEDPLIGDRQEDASSRFEEGSGDVAKTSLGSVDRLVIRLQDRRVYLYRNEEVINSYPVAIGKAGWETPAGTFAVRQMIVDPAWEHPWNGSVVPPGDRNPLGRRWIGFWTDGTNVIGFHGTPNENLVGQAVSHGCVRMKNADIAQLFEQVQVGTTVVVE